MNDRIFINFILDKSGSMSSVRDATISGFNEYLGNLRRQSNIEYTLSLTAFDTTYQTICAGEPLAKFEGLNTANYNPDGSTAIYDAIVATVKAGDLWLQKEAEHQHTYKVLCVVMTDGEENSSRQHSRQNVLDLIKEKEATGYWTFAYLGANQDSWAVGQSIGFNGTATMDFLSTPIGAKSAFHSLSRATMSYSNSSVAATPDFFADTEKEKDAD